MYWSKVIIASLAATPTFAQQRLGGPELLDHVETVGEGKFIDMIGEEGGWVDQQDGADVSAHHLRKIDEQGTEKNLEDAEVFGPESLPQENGFFDLAPHLDPEYLATLTAEDRRGLFGYIGDDDEEVKRHLGSDPCNGKTSFVLKIVPDSSDLSANVFQCFYNGNRVMRKGPFSSANTIQAGMCVPSGELRVEAESEDGNGMRTGLYEVQLNGNIVASSPGSNRWTRRVHTFATPYEASNSNPSPTRRPTPSPTPRPASDVISGRNTCFEPQTNEEQDFLDKHNSDRRRYHEMYDKVYTPLTWSNELAEESRDWAQSLLRYCCTVNLPHDSSNVGKHGENMASNCGSGSWGTKRDANAIVDRWIDQEHGKSNYRLKLHYTQALWRASTHVGCGVAEKDMGNGSTCHTQVCRYQKPGNCAINESNHMDRMLADTSGCQGVPVSC